MRSCCVCDSLRLLHFSHRAVYLLSYRLVHFLLVFSFFFPRCGGQIPCALSANEDLGTLAEYDPLTGHEPNDCHISETTEPYIQESSGENGTLNDLEYDDVTISIALSSPLFTQEREDDASHGRAYHSQDERLSSGQSSSSVGHRTWGGPLWNSLTHKFQTSEKFRATAQKVSKSGFFWNDKESRFSLTVKQRFENTSSKPIMTEEAFKS